MQFRNIPLVAIVMLTFFTPLVCSGASISSLDYSELWRESDTIVVGRVTSITSRGDDHIVDVEVERYLKNRLEASSLLIHYRVRTGFEMVTPEGTVVSSDTSEPVWGFNDVSAISLLPREVREIEGRFYCIFPI